MMSFHGSRASTMMLLTLRSLRRPANRATHFVVPSLGYAPADASNPDKWTLFPHIEKRFDSIKVGGGVLVRAYRSGNSLRLAYAGATGALACSSDLGFGCAALRRSRPDRVDDVSPPRRLIHWPAAPRLALIAQPRPTRSPSLSAH